MNRNFRVERFETKTGIRLHINGEVYRNGDPDPGVWFHSEEDAKRYARSNLKPGLEFSVFDKDGKLMYQHVYDAAYVVREDKRKWWEFWKGNNRC